MMKLEKDKWSLIGDVNRRLSWRECARLQGLPDNISPTGSLKDKYRVIGNAVPPLFAEIIIKPIMDYEKQKTNERNIK
ncbi:Modification methylase HaeIII [compost metagenome]